MKKETEKEKKIHISNLGNKNCKLLFELLELAALGGSVELFGVVVVVVVTAGGLGISACRLGSRSNCCLKRTSSIWN